MSASVIRQPLDDGLRGSYRLRRVHRYMARPADPSKSNCQRPATRATDLALSLSKGGPRVSACFDKLSTVLEAEAPDPLLVADAQISGTAARQASDHAAPLQRPTHAPMALDEGACAPIDYAIRHDHSLAPTPAAGGYPSW